MVLGWQYFGLCWFTLTWGIRKSQSTSTGRNSYAIIWPLTTLPVLLKGLFMREVLNRTLLDRRWGVSDPSVPHWAPSALHSPHTRVWLASSSLTLEWAHGWTSPHDQTHTSLDRRCGLNPYPTQGWEMSCHCLSLQRCSQSILFALEMNGSSPSQEAETCLVLETTTLQCCRHLISSGLHPSSAAASKFIALVLSTGRRDEDCINCS